MALINYKKILVEKRKWHAKGIRYTNSRIEMNKLLDMKWIEKEKREEEKGLVKEYPDIPQTLIDLLKYTNGTYEDNIYFLSSDVNGGGYPYYLLSSNQIIETKNEAVGYCADMINREYDDAVVDERIIDNSKNANWLHFADCMNNGGTS